MKGEVIQTLAHQLGQAASPMIDKLGIASMMTIVGVDVASDSGKIELAKSLSEWGGAFDWVALLAAFGTITFIVKNILEARKFYVETKTIKERVKEGADGE